MGPINPDFIKYQEEQKNVHALEQQNSYYSFGAIPPVIDLSYLKGEESTQVYTQQSYPSSFDLRTQGKVSPVKDQAAGGSCWAFSTFGSLESTLLPSENWDFSENNLKNDAGFDLDKNQGGGNMLMSSAYLARWSGPVNESNDPYDPYTTNSPSNLPVQVHAQNITYIPSRANRFDNNNIKWALMNYGAVQSTIQINYGDFNNYNNGYWVSQHPTTYYYNNEPSEGGHAITIVGWDDNFDKNNFVHTPPGNGAFIVKNSWGTNWGDDGYFYISYYDIWIGTYNAVYTAEPISNYDNVYQYDPLGWTNYAGYGYGSNTAWLANGFYAKKNEQLSAVGLYVPQVGSSYTIYVFKNSNLVSTQSGSISDPGYHTISLNGLVPLNTGDWFVIEVKLTTPNFYYPICLEMPISGYSSQAVANASESWVSPNGQSWTDITTIPGYSNTNVCLKAFTEDSVGIGPKTITVAEGGSCNYSVVLRSQPTSSVTINLGKGAFVNTNRSTLTFSQSNWNTPQYVQVTAIDDHIIGNDVQSVISHTASSSDPYFNGVPISSVYINITDSDKQPLNLSIPYAITCNAGSSSVSIIDTNNNTVISKINVGSSPDAVGITPDGGYAYVSNYNSYNVSVIDIKNMKNVANIYLEDNYPSDTINKPTGIAVSPDGSHVYVADETSNCIDVIDTSLNCVTDIISVGESPQSIVLSPDGTRAYVTNYKDGTVSVIDTTIDQLIYPIKVGSYPTGLAISPDGSHVYVANIGSNSVSVIDTTSNTATSTIPANNNPNDIVFSKDGSRAYVACEGGQGTANGVIYVVDTSTNNVIQTMSVANPECLALYPDGSRLYVTSWSPNIVNVVDTRTNQVVAYAGEGTQPYDIAMTPAQVATPIINEPPVEWTKNFTVDNNNIYGTCVRETPDNGYIVLARGRYASGIYLFKTDAGGNVQWEKTYGGSQYSDARSIDLTNDGGYIIAGQNGSGYLLKTDANGNEQWNNTFNGMAYSVEQTDDNGYIVAGEDTSQDGFLTKFDYGGNLKWTQSWHGNSPQGAIAYSVNETHDGMYIATGFQYYNGYPYVNLVKIDASGNLILDNIYYTDIQSASYREGLSIIESSDGGYVITGHSSNGIDLIKTDSNSNIIWNKWTGLTSNDEGTSIIQTKDGGYILSGYINPNIGGVYVAKTDQYGYMQWNATLGGTSGNFIQQTSDGGYIIVGNSVISGVNEVYLIKLAGARDKEITGYILDKNYECIPSANVTLLNCVYYSNNNTWVSTTPVNMPENPQLSNDGTTSDLYLVEYGGNRIQKLASNGTLIPWGDPNVILNNPFDGCVDPSGNVYISDSGNNRIIKYDPNGTFNTTWGTYGNGYGQFNRPVGMCTDPMGYIYVADWGNNRIQKFDSNGTYITSWGSAGSYGPLYEPQDVCSDSMGDIYVVDWGNNRIEKFDYNGNFITAWGGSFGSGPGQFGRPEGINADPSGYVYVTDGDNNRIQKFDSSGNWISMWGSYGHQNGQFNLAEAIASDPSGNLYVMDSNNARIEEFDSNGNFITSYKNSTVGTIIQAYSVFTDKTGYNKSGAIGSYTFNGLEPGQYIVTANKSGHMNATFVDLLHGTNNANIILNDYETPGLGFNNSSYNIREDADLITINVTMCGTTNQAASVNYTTYDGNATNGKNYQSVSGKLTFQPGETSKTFTIPIIDDGVYSSQKYFTIQLYNASNLALETSVTTVYIDNVEPAPILYFNASSYNVSWPDSNATITITKSGLTNLPASVHYSTSNGDALAGTDYTATSGTLTFGPSDTSKSFNVSLLHNPSAMGNKSFNVVLSSPSNATLGTPDIASVNINRSAYQYSYNLVPEWNLISVPLNVSDNSVDGFFPASVRSGIVDVWAWNESVQNWMYYSPSPDPYFASNYPALTHIESGRAYWVEMNKSASFTITGTIPTGAPASPVGLVPSWNFVGPTGLSSSTPATLYPNNVVDVWAWDESVQNWMYYSPSPDPYFASNFPAFSSINTGHGYWVELPS